MLADLSIEKLLVLALIGLFVLGPERLPAAVSWVSDMMRRARRLVEDTQRSLQRDLGPEFDQLREPLRELREPLQQLRNLDRPSHVLGRYLTTPAQPASAEAPSSSPAARPGQLGIEHSERTPAGPPPIDPDAT